PVSWLSLTKTLEPDVPPVFLSRTHLPEDPKFKTGPDGLAPPTDTGRPDHVKEETFDPRTADVPDARLLGERQLAFLRDWAADWRGADMKATLSQTVFAGAATHHGGNMMPLVADYDSNGWPQAGRNRALHEIRRGFAFMIGGDQHLATILHHGIDDWNDAGWSFLVPSVANLYLRAWLPTRPPRTRLPGLPDYTGEYLEGFGNRITVWAATNPGPMGREPAWLHDKKPGYGIVRFRKSERTITIECWPRFSDPSRPGAVQYDGWPKTVTQEDQYSRAAAAYLPKLEITGATDPVVQVLDEGNGEVVYTLRIRGANFRPKVFRPGTYGLRIGEPDRDAWVTLTGVAAAGPDIERLLTVRVP
ncbi:MAG: twin-arginine translocation pathway signal protein, partial [Lentisphaeria bacterium]|nr:twin-arginine translocation pathway signal protein [Lentisphaeria bacterium]